MVRKKLKNCSCPHSRYAHKRAHGDLSQQQRDLTMQKFRNHTVQFLVATDVAARGLDVDDLTHVINSGLPDDVASYTHRSGRTGRAGKKVRLFRICQITDMMLSCILQVNILMELIRRQYPILQVDRNTGYQTKFNALRIYIKCRHSMHFHRL